MPMIVVAQVATEAEADEITLALSSGGISSRAVVHDGVWEIEVHLRDAARAAPLLRNLHMTEQDSEPEPASAPRALNPMAGLAAAAVLIVAHAWAVWAGHEQVVRRAGCSGYLLARGELHRCVTALFVHADLQHLLGNTVAIAVLVPGLVAGTGAGIGALLVIVAGGLGNAFSGLARGSYRLSIGASTAVFATVGILAARQCFQRLRVPSGRLKAWVPLGAALALLSMLGAEPHTDLSAHLLGMAAGVAVGVIHALTMRAPPPWGAQMGAGVAAALITAGAWFAAGRR